MAVEHVTGALDTVLEIDLSSRTFSRVSIPRQMRLDFLGGKGLGMKLLYDRLKPGTDPLSEQNLIIIMTGVLAGTHAPCSGRFHAVFKSPLTGITGSSSCGGSFGRQLKTNGFDGIIIKGKSDSPVRLHIENDTVTFIDATAMWGMDTHKAREALPGRVESLFIGPAGERLVRFANVASGHRYLGRGGLGAVFGSKNLKGVTAAKGRYRIVPADPQGFEKLKDRAQTYLNRNQMTLLMRQFGTAANAAPIIRNQMLPVNNFSLGSHRDAEKITGQTIQSRHDTSYHTCKPCSIFCGHKGTFNGREAAVPEYETLVLMGSTLGIFDPDRISEFNEICNRAGMDTISAGGTIAWAMEASQRGLISEPLTFGSSESVIHALDSIASGRGFGKELGTGSRALSGQYGGASFAIQVKGLEMAGYDPRGAFGQGLGYAVANRGACHLSSFPVAFENLLNLLEPATVRAKPEFVKFFEDLYAAINSLDICQFTGYGLTLETLLTRMTPRPVLKFLMQNLPAVALALVDFSLFPGFFSTVSGIRLSSREFLRAGERIHILERLMNTNEGIRKSDDTLPERLLSEPRADDPEKRVVPLAPMLEKYYRLRGYDENGIPPVSLLNRLGIN